MLRFVVVALALASVMAILPSKTLRMGLNHVHEEHENSHDRMLFYSQKPKEYVHTNLPNHVSVLAFGEDKNYRSLLPDILSTTTWVTSKDCSSKCFQNDKVPDSHKYSCDKGCSKDSGKDKAAKKSTELIYNHDGPVNVLTGVNSHVTLGFNSSHYATKVPVVLAETFKNRKLVQADGVLGLAAAKDNVLTRLKASKLIENEQFSYFFSKTDSFLLMGADESYLYKINHKLNTYKFDAAAEHGLWNVEVTDAKYKGKSGKSLAAAKAKAYFDSNVYSYQVPKNVLTSLQSEVEKALGGGHDCKVDAKMGYLDCKCKDATHQAKLPTLSLKFKGDEKNTHDLLPTGYSSLHNGRVHIYFQEGVKSLGNNWVLGRNWLTNFYTVFDQEKGQIRLAASSLHTPGELYQSSGIRGSVIGLGFALMLVSIGVLFSILKPVKTNRVSQPQGRDYRQY